MSHPKNLLLPTDFSADALFALEHALRLARESEAVLHLLHVVEPPPVTPPLRDCPMPYFPIEEIEADARKRLDAWVDGGDGVEVRREVVHGRAAHEILAYARRHPIDLIVMGTHGRRGFSRLLMGSTTEAVLRGASCPVLTVRVSKTPRKASAESPAAGIATEQPPQEVARAGP